MNQPLRPLFGVAGLSDSYTAAGHKTSLAAPEYTASFGLTAFEYQCGRGVRLSEATAAALREQAQKHGITFSLHAPYYISMSSLEEEKRLASLRYLQESAVAVDRLGGDRVIFHAGGPGKQSREESLEKTAHTLNQARALLDEQGYEHIHLCPETMGKVGQLGTLDEIMALCKLDERHIPCIDFGHLNARTQGGLQTQADFAAVLDEIDTALGGERAKRFHVHFSKIEYAAGGEKRHLTFTDNQFGPPFEPLLDLCFQRGLAPVVICESAGTQTEDAKAMLDYYNSLK